MRDGRHAGPIALLWTVPCAYGLLLIGASVWWLTTGEPFDQDSYTRIGGSAWSAIVGNRTPAQAVVWTAMVRLLGGSNGLLAGGLTIALAAFGYPSRARWVWFTMWLLPTHALLDLVILSASGGLSVVAILWDVGLALAMIGTLLTAYPHFFSSRLSEHQ